MQPLHRVLSNSKSQKMLKSLVCFTLLFVTDVVVCNPDYIFNHEVNGWLKLHRIPATWQDAFLSCFYEGAVLASPLNEQLSNALSEVVKKSELDNSIYLGANALFSERDFISIEGVPLADMHINWGTNSENIKPENCLIMSTNGKTYISSCNQWFPYICYKKSDNTTIFNKCGTFDDEYHLSDITGSCYKYHKEPRTWFRAHKICAAEGGHLAIINDKQEADVVTALRKTHPKVAEWDPSHIGLRDWNKDSLTWLTIHGEKIENVYHTWAPGQPDNKGVNVCAGILRDATLDDNWCTFETSFICEKDPNSYYFENVQSEESSTCSCDLNHAN